MSDFSFSATAECNECGAYLSSSDEDCDHNGQPVSTHIFRRLGEGRDSMTGVQSTPMHKWYRLEEKLGDDWIAYEYLGPKDQVEAMLNGDTWDSVKELPKLAMSLDAPSNVGDGGD
jgi:hypothetical protein